jgi:hypothetical protein
VQLGAGKRISRRNRGTKAKATSASSLPSAIASAGADVIALAPASKLSLPNTDSSNTDSGATPPPSAEVLLGMHAQARMPSGKRSADVERLHSMQHTPFKHSDHVWPAQLMGCRSAESDNGEVDVGLLGNWSSFPSVPDLPDDIMLTSNMSNRLGVVSHADLCLFACAITPEPLCIPDFAGSS